MNNVYKKREKEIDSEKGWGSYLWIMQSAFQFLKRIKIKINNSSIKKNKR